MSKKEEFYIGYLDQAPTGIRRFLRRAILLGLFLLVAAGATIFAITQKPSPNGTFEFGTLTEVTGTYFDAPFPMIRMKGASGTPKNILLLGYGKAGAWNFISSVEKAIGRDLNGREVSLKGTLLYYNGKTLLELPPESKGNFKEKAAGLNKRQATGLGQVTLQGEIIDPKCYFGVMKPGRGKIHRSCAVRCISGGIPPVLVVNNESGTADYYLITGKDGKPINASILPKVGKPISLQGTLERIDDWYVLKTAADQMEVLEGRSAIYSAR